MPRQYQGCFSVTSRCVFVLLCSMWLSVVGLQPVVAMQAAAPAIKADEGLPQVLWQDADKVVGKVADVYGQIVDIGKTQRIRFLNVDDEKPARFTFVIFEDNLKNFPDSLEAAYGGKLVRVRGKVSLYRDKPQIVLTSASQITVVDALPSASVLPATKPFQGTQVKIATYNILNMFDEHDDPYRNDEGTPTKPRAEVDAIAKTIRTLNADVLALQEVENRFYLQRFVDVFLADMGYEVVLLEGNDGRGIDVGLLSRIPVGRVVSHQHLRFPDAKGNTMRFNRDLLVVELNPTDGDPFEMWVVHLKSNSGGKEHVEHNRLGEARTIRKLLDERLTHQPDARIVLSGDFNDTWDSETMKTIVGSGSTGMRCFANVDSQDTPPTYNKPPYLSMIDFILVSPAMAKGFVADSYGVIGGTVESSGSDHNPVYATFRLKADKPE